MQKSEREPAPKKNSSQNKQVDRKVHLPDTVSPAQNLSEPELMRMKRREAWARFGLSMEDFPERDSDQVTELKKHLKRQMH